MRPESSFARPWIPDALAAAMLVLTVLAEIAAPGSPDPMVRRAGGLVMLVALPFIVLPFRQLARHGGVSPGGRYMETTRVVDSGIYSIVRHPQYVGYCLLFAGLALRRQTLDALAVSAAGIALLGWQMVVEEHYLRAELGEAYARYAERVPRWNFIAGLWRRLTRPGSGNDPAR